MFAGWSAESNSPGSQDNSVAESAAEGRLMARVMARCHEPLVEACRYSSVPPAFLAALTANESGGNPLASRYEPAVHARLQAVAAKRATYGRIRPRDLALELRDMQQSRDVSRHSASLGRVLASDRVEQVTALPDACLRDLATSWGLTQIMGYHMVGRAGTVRDLLDPRRHYQIALELLAEFAARFELDLRSEFAELFRCWNTGQPQGKSTHDPRYVENGLRRLELYQHLMAARQPATHVGAV